MSKRLPLFFVLAVTALAALPAAAQLPVVTINGPDGVTVSRNCYTVTWEAVASSGTPPYSYVWKLDGSTISTSSSATKQYCSTSGVCSVFSDTIEVMVTDFNGREDTDSLDVTITLKGCNASGSSCAC